MVRTISTSIRTPASYQDAMHPIVIFYPRFPHLSVYDGEAVEILDERIRFVLFDTVCSSIFNPQIMNARDRFLIL